VSDKPAVSDKSEVSTNCESCPTPNASWYTSTTGADALQLGLVDQLGGLQDAIEVARREASLSQEVGTSRHSNPMFMHWPVPCALRPLYRSLQHLMRSFRHTARLVHNIVDSQSPALTPTVPLLAGCRSRGLPAAGNVAAAAARRHAWGPADDGFCGRRPACGHDGIPCSGTAAQQHDVDGQHFGGQRRDQLLAGGGAGNGGGGRRNRARCRADGCAGRPSIGMRHMRTLTVKEECSYVMLCCFEF